MSPPPSPSHDPFGDEELDALPRGARRTIGDRQELARAFEEVAALISPWSILARESHEATGHPSDWWRLGEVLADFLDCAVAARRGDALDPSESGAASRAQALRDINTYGADSIVTRERMFATASSAIHELASISTGLDGEEAPDPGRHAAAIARALDCVDALRRGPAPERPLPLRGPVPDRPRPPTD